MARVTVEDCVTIVPNRFELCLIASNRAKSILSGAATRLDRTEKPSVISLREIASKEVDVDNIRKNIIRNIRNQGIVEYEDLVQSSSDNNDVVAEEVESQNIILKDNTFVADNIEIDD
ncbi:MAG: DNA-directed RNA polymerase subunit omega [Rickettsiales bacterium]|jgi:DNA-directed RNA polymerase subunit omega